jgi:hypothetical protein
MRTNIIQVQNEHDEGVNRTRPVTVESLGNGPAETIAAASGTQEKSTWLPDPVKTSRLRLSARTDPPVAVPALPSMLVETNLHDCARITSARAVTRMKHETTQPKEIMKRTRETENTMHLPLSMMMPNCQE